RVGIIAQVQRGHGRPANRRQAQNAGTIVSPTEMVEPSMETWDEKRYRLPGCRVFSRRMVGLMPIAQRATKPEIGFVVCATLCERDNVLDFQTGHDQVLRAE